MKKLLYSTSRGSAIPLVLIAVVILSVMGAGLLSLGFQSRVYAIRTTSEIAARNAADAGLTKAIYQMNEKLQVKPWNESTLPMATGESLTNCDATFSYTVALNDGAYHIESIGSSGQTQKTVNAVLRLNGPFEYAIFTENSIELKNGAVIDGFNYDADDQNLQVGTNSIEPDSIDLKNGVMINGDVVVGLGGLPDIVISDAGATITGEIYTAPENYELTPVTVPEYLQDMPSQGAINNNTTITSSAKYDEIDLANGRIITIDGNIALYIIGDVTLKNSAELRIVGEDINPDASLILYLGGDVEVKNSGTINNITEDAKKLKMYGLNSCQGIVLKNGSDFYGAIYAPNADVAMMNSADMFGAVAAKSFEQNNSATFNYDAALREVDSDDEVVRFIIKRWSE